MSNSIERHSPAKPEVYGQDHTYQAYQESSDEVSLRQYYSVLSSRKWFILAVLVSVFALVAIQTFTSTPIYQSIAKVQIDPEQTNILPYKGILQGSENYLVTAAYLQTQYRLLESRVLARRVIKKLNLSDHPVFSELPSGSFLHQVVESLKSLLTTVFSIDQGAEEEADKELRRVYRFLENLQVRPIRSSRLVEVSFTSHEAEFAAQVVNTLVDEYIEHNFETRYEATGRATDFLQKQLQGLKIEVEGSEEDMISYAREHGILHSPERKNTVLQKLEDLNKEMTKVQAALILTTATFEAVEKATVAALPQSLETELIISLQTQLFKSKQELASLSKRFGSGWPDVIRVNNEISEVKEQLRQENFKAIQEARTEYQVAVRRYELLFNALEEQKQLANRLNEDLIQYNILQREVESNKQLYEGLLQRLKQAGVSAGLESGNIHVVDHGEVPSLVYRPRTKLNLALGLTLGLVLGVGLAFLTEYLDNTVKTPDQAEQFLALPSLGAIPSLEEVAEPELPSKVEGTAIVPYTATGSRMWEFYRSLRTSILLSSSGHQPKAILVTSSLSGEGKTTTVINTGIVFAQTGARTLLMDLDMRGPMLATYLSVNGDGGMSTFLSGNSDLAPQIRQTAVPNLFVLPSGPVPPNPAELIGSERMDEGLALLGKYFKYILIDSPPLLAVTDGLVLSPKVEGVVMVIRAGKTPRNVVRKASDRLHDVGAKILGTLINQADIENSRYYYYYYHRDYGRYGTDV